MANSRNTSSEQFTSGRGVIGKPASQNLLSFAHNGLTTNKIVDKRNPNSYTDFDMLARGVSVYLFNLMIEDLNKFKTSDGLSNTKYDIPPIESQDYTLFSCDIIMTSVTDEEINKLIAVKAIPSIQDIYKYLNYIKDKLNFIPPNMILTCIYLKRICETANIFLNILNYRLLFTVSLIIAQKIWMEPYKQTKEFAVLFPDNYNKDQLRLWERDLLSIIYNDTKIEPSLYGNMYGTLKNLSKQVHIKFNLNEGIVNDMKSVISGKSGNAPSVDSYLGSNNSNPTYNEIYYSNDNYELSRNLLSANISNPNQINAIDKKGLSGTMAVVRNIDSMIIVDETRPNNQMALSRNETDTVIFSMSSGYFNSDANSVQTVDLMASNMKLPHEKHQNVSSLTSIDSQISQSLGNMSLDESNKSEILKIPNESAQSISNYKIERSLHFTSDNLPTIHNIANPDVNDQLRLWERDHLTIIYNETKIEPSLYGNMYGRLKDLSKQVPEISNVNECIDKDKTSVISGKSGNAPSVDTYLGSSNSIPTCNEIYDSNDKFEFTRNLLSANISYPNQINAEKGRSGTMAVVRNMDIEINKSIPDVINVNSKISEKYITFLPVDSMDIVDDTRPNNQMVLTRNETDTVIFPMNSGYFNSDANSVQTVDLMASNMKLPSKPNLLDLVRKGVTYEELKALRYTIYDFINAGYQISDLLAASYTLKELLNVKTQIKRPDGTIVATSYFTIYDLREQGGFTITDFLDEGFTLLDLKSSGYVAVDYMTCGISIRNLLEEGYSREDLHVKLKYTLLQLKRAHIAMSDVNNDPKLNSKKRKFNVDVVDDYINNVLDSIG